MSSTPRKFQPRRSDQNYYREYSTKQRIRWKGNENDPAISEQKMRKFTTNENQTTNIRFDQNHNRVLMWELEAKVKE